MSPRSEIEVADRKSRQRSILFAWATVVFLFVQVITHPAFSGEAYAHGWRRYAWALNAVLLLMLLGGGGGIMNSPRVRALINDDVAKENNRTACKVGFWVAMLCALALYVIPAFQSFTGAQVSYLVVTLGAGAALLTFSWLEYRAHSDE
jgi:hypothetical protein